ncbi:MAG TPA: PQQ-binding-like beta-propeller repeat protein [Gemmataceae bacterium]|nr:PQQ-binding-like beta-propeller repeat protein [Gemmataceae bacterium]
MYRSTAAILLVAAAAARADDWPQWMGPTRDGQWKETGILEKFSAGGPKKLWSVEIGGGYAGPAVANGKVYVTDYQATEGGRGNNPNAATKREGKERVLCLDAATGKELWKHEYDCPYAVSYAAGPRCTPTVADGKVYALGTMGDLRVLDADKGTLLWSKDFKKDYKSKTPMWGFTGHPLVYKNLVICLVGGESLLVAFDKDTGKEAWKSLTPPGEANPGYCPPTLIEAGGTKQLVIWHPKKIVSVNPDDGKKYWDVDLEAAFGMSIMGPRQAGDYLFAGGIGYACVVVKLATDRPAAEEVWRGKRETGVYPVNSTPIIDDGVIYAVDQPGSLRAVKLETGERLWGTQKPVTGKDEKDERPVNSGTAFLVKNGPRYFLFGETGHLIIAMLTPKGYEEIDRAKILDPTNDAFGSRPVVWSHPAFANKCVYARNDKEIVCYSLAAE